MKEKSKTVLMSVRTKHGAHTVPVRHIMGDKILLVDGEGPEGHPMWPGSFLVHNTELPSRTQSRAEYLVVADGLFHLARLCQHVDEGELLEADMITSDRDHALALADRLKRSGRVNEEEAKAMRAWLGLLEKNHMEPKRNPHKLRASQQFAKSKSANEKRGRGIGQSSMIAYAAQYNLRLRVQDARNIRKYFSRRALAVYPLIEDARSAVNRVWAFFGGDEMRNDRTLEVRGEARWLITGLLNGEERPKSVQRSFYDHLAPIEAHVAPYRPLRTLGTGIVSVTCELNRLIYEPPTDATRQKMFEACAKIVQDVRCVRTIFHLEEKVVANITLRDGTHQAIAESELDKAIRRLNDMTDAETVEFPRIPTALLLMSAQNALTKGNRSLASTFVKKATHMLAH